MSHGKAIHLAALVLAAAALPAAAQQPHWYAGISAGQAKTDSDFLNNREDSITNATDIRSSFDATDNAWKATFGYRISPLLSIEANYTDYGSVRSDTRFTVGGGPGVGGVVVDRDVRGFGVDAVVSAPLGDRFAVFGRVGAFRAETRAHASLSGDTFFSDGTPGTDRTNKSTETVAKYGVGLDWNIAPQWTARLEYERLNQVGKKFETGASGTTGEADVAAWMLGAVFRF